MRAAIKQGLVDYVPMSVARVPDMVALGRIAVDVALIQVSPPDAFGYVSLGISVDIIPAAISRARLVIAEVNPPCRAHRATPLCTSAASTGSCRCRPHHRV